MSKFPIDVSNLFKPQAPLRQYGPCDQTPIYTRQTNPKISGLSSYLTQLTDYSTKEFPLKKVRPNRAKPTREDKEGKEDLRDRWDPSKDPHMIDTDPYCTIFIGRLPYDLNEYELQTKFQQYGDITRVRIVRDRTTTTTTTNPSRSRGYGFIVFDSPQSVKRCIRSTGVYRGIEIKGRRCIVDHERGRTNKYFVPRRLGGGLGGRSASDVHNVYHQMQGPSRFDRRPFEPRAPPPTGPGHATTTAHPHTTQYTARSHRTSTPAHTNTMDY